ncbi:MAG: hypothetical protein N2712_04580 [Brevinematales bacterium]|nr:hypothetical protein [Brevinematales bacterium]
MSGTSSNLTNGVLEVGYPDVASLYQWNLELRDFEYYNVYFYVV